MENRIKYYLNLINKRLLGCYENIEGGNPQDALVDLTGGIVEIFQVQNENIDYLLNCLINSFDSDSCFLIASVDVSFFLNFIYKITK
jgi:hypothetical protein